MESVLFSDALSTVFFLKRSASLISNVNISRALCTATLQIFGVSEADLIQILICVPVHIYVIHLFPLSGGSFICMLSFVLRFFHLYAVQKSYSYTNALDNVQKL